MTWGFIPERNTSDTIYCGDAETSGTTELNFEIIEDSCNGIDNDFKVHKGKTIRVPKREISLMWNQRSVDTFLGLPFNIASYGLLLHIIANEVDMIPDELIGNLGDTHLYLNHIEQAKEQIGREPFDLPQLKTDAKMDGICCNVPDDFEFGQLELDLNPNPIPSIAYHK